MMVGRPPAAGTWCPTARKPLFLRSETPRLSDWMGLRRQRRGAPPPANPYFFVRKHHVFRIGWAFAGRDVVPHRPQTLISSSGSTTFFGLDGPSPAESGAPPPANPYFFVRKHHVFRFGWPFGGRDVVPHCPQTLLSSSGGTTSIGLDGMRWETVAPFPFLSI